ncbi:MAG: hypothetical protein ACRDNS_04860, partial [Trebonia sp.]
AVSPPDAATVVVFLVAYARQGEMLQKHIKMAKGAGRRGALVGCSLSARYGNRATCRSRSHPHQGAFSVNDLNGHRVLQSPHTRSGGAAPQIPSSVAGTPVRSTGIGSALTSVTPVHTVALLGSAWVGGEVAFEEVDLVAGELVDVFGPAGEVVDVVAA